MVTAMLIVLLVMVLFAAVSIAVGCVEGDFLCTLYFVFGTFGQLVNLIPEIMEAIVKANE